jgi:hypothetical protein
MPPDGWCSLPPERPSRAGKGAAFNPGRTIKGDGECGGCYTLLIGVALWLVVPSLASRFCSIAAARRSASACRSLRSSRSNEPFAMRQLTGESGSGQKPAPLLTARMSPSAKSRHSPQDRSLGQAGPRCGAATVPPRALRPLAARVRGLR